MKIKSTCLYVALMSAGATAYAKPTMLHNCKNEIKKFSCEAQSESYAYDCLNSHKERTMNKGFTRKCFDAYALYEKENGVGDKIESHQIDQPEHSE